MIRHFGTPGLTGQALAFWIRCAAAQVTKISGAPGRPQSFRAPSSGKAPATGTDRSNPRETDQRTLRHRSQPYRHFLLHRQPGRTGGAGGRERRRRHLAPTQIACHSCWPSFSMAVNQGHHIECDECARHKMMKRSGTSKPQTQAACYKH